jgi:hypothetical protein
METDRTNGREDSYRLLPKLKSVHHTYDIDLSKVDKKLRKANITVWTKLLENIAEENKIDLTKFPLAALIVGFSSQYYIPAFAFYISSIEKWEIDRFLDFQGSKFKGNNQYKKSQFSNMIEYYLPNVMPKMSRARRETILDKIMSWCRSQPESNNFKTHKSKVSKKLVKWPDKEKLNEILNCVTDELKKFSGYNHYGEKIMLDDDYVRLEQYTLYLIENKELPPNIKPINRIRLSNHFIIYNYYLIHQIAFGKKRQIFVLAFLNKVFKQLEDIYFSEKDFSSSTLYKLFSVKPSSYNSDIEKFKF